MESNRQCQILDRTVATMKVIDLDDHRDGDVPVLSGHRRGKAARKATRLNVADETEDEIIVRVPEDVYVVVSSFLFGLLGPSIRKLVENRFHRRFRFEGGVNEAALSYAIREALRSESLLSTARLL